MNSDHRDSIITVIRLIPRGKVATYGQVARIAGIPRNSRQVGTVLKSLPAHSNVPWYRVVNSRGEISIRDDGDSEQYQRQLLEDEDVEFDRDGRIALSVYRWNM